jgi:hypothetical protein
MKVTLSKPLLTHSGNVTELELKEPTCESFLKHKEPFKLSFDKDDKPIYDFDSKACAGFISDMCGVNELLLKHVSARDFIALRFAMVNVIFAGAGSENPTET